MILHHSFIDMVNRHWLRDSPVPAAVPGAEAARRSIPVFGEFIAK